ncbi:hypothetical protein H9639_08045 [Arthrobacter sp. Sa2CUA1]|uniref:Uncharacterized protein n=1 Tax=Arthrobacter gallicola TaxID=2762225 RepID=A0ABR8URV5_9MICC|nr:hypothetical protein [Arthrobacter gallicola]MBD7995244.1 hypothetical protein [Arthrobacter gallicola]
MDIPLNSSLVLAAAVGLWLLWVVPQYLHGRQEPAASVPGRTGSAASAASSAANEPDPSSQGNIMYNTSTGVQPPHGPGRPQQGADRGSGDTARPAAAAAAPFRVRYDRLVLAGLGLVFLAGVLTGGIAALLGLVSGWLPAAAAAGTLAVFAGLRNLAVRDRRARRARYAAAMAQRAAEPAAATPSRHNPKADIVFDASSSAASAKGTPAPAPSVQPAAPAPKPLPRLSAGELRAAALAEAAKSAEASSWEPVDVPKPTYVDAPMAPRPAPKPLAVPASPKPVLKTPIRPVAAPAAGSTPIDPRPATGILNLDDVLQRRRA